MAGAQVQDWTAEQYFADPSLSRSKLELFRSSPAMYHGREVVKTIPEPEATAAMRLGTLVHLATLEPDEYQRQVFTDMTPPPYAGKGAKERREAFTAERDAWLAELPRDVLLVEAEDRARVEAMRDAIFAHPLALRLLGVSEREVSVTWQDPETRLDCRARLDLLAHGRGLWLNDIKTSSDPGEGFAVSAARYGYHRQAAFYSRAVEALNGARPRFSFIVVRSAPPYEVAVWHMRPEDIRVADTQIAASMRQLARCMETDNWTAPWQEPGGQVLNMPRWALQEEV